MLAICVNMCSYDYDISYNYVHLRLNGNQSWWRDQALSAIHPSSVDGMNVEKLE